MGCAGTRGPARAALAAEDSGVDGNAMADDASSRGAPRSTPLLADSGVGTRLGGSAVASKETPDAGVLVAICRPGQTTQTTAPRPRSKHTIAAARNLPRLDPASAGLESMAA